MAHSANVMKFTLDQPHIEVHDGKDIQVGDYLGLVAYYPHRIYPAWNHWVKVLEVREDYIKIQFMSSNGLITATNRDRSKGKNKWVKMITTREYKVDQEPLDDEETL